MVNNSWECNEDALKYRIIDKSTCLFTTVKDSCTGRRKLKFYFLFILIFCFHWLLIRTNRFIRSICVKCSLVNNNVCCFISASFVIVGDSF